MTMHTLPTDADLWACSECGNVVAYTGRPIRGCPLCALRAELQGGGE